MRKKIYAICLVIAMVFTMTACGTSAKEEKKEEDKKVEESTAAPEKEEEEKEEEAVSEPGPYTGDTEISEAMKKELGASIAETFTKEYLEPNNINPADYVWPTAVDWAPAWQYLEAMKQIYCLTIDVEKEFEYEESNEFTNDPDKILFVQSIWNGVVNFLESQSPYDADFAWNLTSETLGAGTEDMYNYLSTNITFQ